MRNAPRTAKQKIDDGRLALYSEPTFRMFKPERLSRPDALGNTWVQLCEEWVEGRWEGFVSVFTSRPQW